MASSINILKLLAGSDRRSIGQASEVVAMVLRQPALFNQLMSGLWSTDPLIAMRAADAAEKVSAKKPELLLPLKSKLLRLLAEATQQELRWHLAQMVPRLPLTRTDRRKAAVVFECYLKDKSSIVKTFAMQALAELAAVDNDLQPRIRELVREHSRNGTAAMRARGRRLLRQMEGAQ